MHLVAQLITAAALVSAPDAALTARASEPVAVVGEKEVSAAATSLPVPLSGLKLAPPKTASLGEGKRPFITTPTGPLAGMLGSLAAVLALFFICVILFRGGKGKGSQALPKDVIEVLGRAPFHGKQQLQLVRVGRKLLLVAISPTGTETLTEISDPQEVDRLVGICQQNNPSSITATFRQVLQQVEKEPAPGGFWGRDVAV